MKKLILTAAMACTMAITGGNLVHAETTQTTPVDIEIKAGEFSLKAPLIGNFDEVTLMGTTQKVAVPIADAFRVKDLRGTQAGWKVNVNASQFTSTGGKTLPKGSLTLAQVDKIEQVHVGEGALPKASQTAPTIIDNGAIEVIKATAGTGMGIYDFSFTGDRALEVAVDSTTAMAGQVYTSTITWDLIQAP